MRGRLWKYLKETPTWVWLALFLISAIMATHSLRQNNFHMIQLRNNLYAADKSGQGVDQALNNLRSYVYGHMNTDLSSGGNTIKPPIQLKYTYDRLVAAEQNRVNEANAQIYRDGQAYCQQAQPGKYREDCFKAYVDQRNVKANPVAAALYQFDFVSPTWSPDAAGWWLVASIILGLVFAISFSADRWSAWRLGRHRRKRP